MSARAHARYVMRKVENGIANEDEAHHFGSLIYDFR